VSQQVALKMNINSICHDSFNGVHHYAKLEGKRRSVQAEKEEQIQIVRKVVETSSRVW